MALTDKITLKTKVVDQNLKPLYGANIHIDRKAIASTNYDGTVVIPGIADSFSEVRITYLGKADYVISSVFLPAQVILKDEATGLEEITITIPKKPATTTTETSNSEEKKPLNWLLWISIIGLGIQVKKYYDDKNKVVKAKI